jgi:hypothetical protein
MSRAQIDRRMVPSAPNCLAVVCLLSYSGQLVLQRWSYCNAVPATVFSYVQCLIAG